MLTIPRLLNIITALVIAIICLLISASVFGYFAVTKKVQGYAVTDSGTLIPLIPLDKPFLNDSRVTGFVEECLRTSFAHDFENFRLTMGAAKTCYTPDGALMFESAMTPLLQDIRAKNLILASSLEPTVVVRTYMVNGVVHWQTQTPMVLYRRGTRESLNPLKFRVESVVQRVSLDQHPRGVSLRTINLRPL